MAHPVFFAVTEKTRVKHLVNSKKVIVGALCANNYFCCRAHYVFLDVVFCGPSTL